MKKNFIYAFKRTIPIMAGFFPIGIAYGLLMMNSGYSYLWTGFTSLFVLAGSLQFLMIDFFNGFVPISAIVIMSLLLNSRHIFYGISFIDKFKKYGPWKYFMIYTLTDENYSLLCSYKTMDGTDEKIVNILSSAFVLFYWVIFSMLGGLIGSLITFDITGIDFALTALFAVILVEQLMVAKSRKPAVIAFISSVLCVFIFSPSKFILPSLLITVVTIMISRDKIESNLYDEDREII